MSVLHQDPVSAIDPRTPLGQEPTHAVCACQVDATPRLALCGTDVSGEDESWTDTMCTVCFEFILSKTPCGRCH